MHRLGGFDPHQTQRKHKFDMNVTDTVTLCLHTSTFPLQIKLVLKHKHTFYTFSITKDTDQLSALPFAVHNTSVD